MPFNELWKEYKADHPELSDDMIRIVLTAMHRAYVRGRNAGSDEMVATLAYCEDQCTTLREEAKQQFKDGYNDGYNDGQKRACVVQLK